MNILFLSGIANDAKMIVKSLTNKIELTGSGGSNIYNNIENKDLQQFHLVLDLTKGTKVTLKNIDLIFNQIADADTHSKVLEKAKELLDQLKLPCINHPDNIINTTRDKMADILQGIPNLIVPKTIKLSSYKPHDMIDVLKEHDMKFPVIIREAGEHGGMDTFFAKSATALKTLYAIPHDGREFYITEYIEYKDKSKLYSKARIVVVNGTPYIRHCIFSKDWMIHISSREEKYIEMEKKYLESFEENIKPKILSAVKQIAIKVKLELFGIDCHIKDDGTLVVFEVNANLQTVLSKNDFTDIYVQKISDAVVDMIKTH